MGKLKHKYLQKNPIITNKEDGSVSIEGVSEKQYPLPVPWTNPEYIFVGNPGENASGDMDIHPRDLDLNRPLLQCTGLKAFEEAPAEVKRIFSLEMGRNRDARQVLLEDARELVAEHKYDMDSNVVRIAQLTVQIRDLQRNLAELRTRGWRNGQGLRKLAKIVNHRKNRLAVLRELDYPKFEWLLEKLDLVYKPLPLVETRVIRRKHTEMLTNLLCDETRTFKLQSFKEELEADQPNFLRRKAEILSKIMKEEQELGLKETVTQEDIEACLAKAEESEKISNAQDKPTRTYYVFEEEIVEAEHKVLT